MTKTTPSFVTEIRLIVSPYQEKILNKRFEASRQVYNACLGEGLKRLDLMRERKAYKFAVKMPNGKDKTHAFNELRKEFDLVGKYSLQDFAKQFNRCWITDHVGSQLIKAIAVRAFNWVNEYAFGKRGRPKFKKYGAFNSVESGFFGKEFLFEREGNEWVATWTVGRLWNGEKFSGNGKSIKMKSIVDESDPVIKHGLDSRLKYVRIVRKVLNGKFRFYAQLVCEGLPYAHIVSGKGVGGVDIGPSTIAGVMFPEGKEPEAFLKMFCQELKDIDGEIKTIQRQVSRQQRENNKSNFENDKWVKNPGGKNWTHKRGKVKKGSRNWVKSNRQKQNEVRLRELKRKQAAHRRSLHGYLVNRIVETVDEIKLEKLSYKAFQRMFGKSVGMRAPGAFVALLKQRIEQYDGTVHEFSTRNTRLSQLDHKTGELKKKSLSQRWHTFDDEDPVQRDLYSAFLAVCVEDGAFDVAIANKLWPGAGPLLRTTLKEIETSELGGVKIPSSFGLNRIKKRKRQRQSRSSES